MSEKGKIIDVAYGYRRRFLGSNKPVTIYTINRNGGIPYKAVIDGRLSSPVKGDDVEVCLMRFISRLVMREADTPVLGAPIRTIRTLTNESGP